MSKSKAKSTREDKRARFAGKPAKKSRRISPTVWIVVGLLAIGGVGGVLIALSGGSPKATAAVPGAGGGGGAAAGGSGQPLAGAALAATKGHAPYAEVKGEDGAVRLPAATFEDKKAHFYTYMNNGQPIEFFVVKGTDGQVHTAFNACDVCFPAKKGYHQEGDVMVCNNCGRRFPTDQIGLIRGGCNPAPLTAQIAGDTLVIQLQDLVAGLSFFAN